MSSESLLLTFLDRKRSKGLGASTFGGDQMSIREKQGSQVISETMVLFGALSYQLAHLSVQGDVSVEFTESTQVTQLDEAMEEYIQAQIEEARRKKNALDAGEQPEASSQRSGVVIVDGTPQGPSPTQSGVRGWATATSRQHLVEEVDLGQSAKLTANQETLRALELAEKEGRLQALDERLGGEGKDKQALSQWKDTFFKRK